MDGTATTAPMGKVYPSDDHGSVDTLRADEISGREREQLEQALTRIETFQVMKTGAIPRALRDIAEEFSTRRTALVIDVLDALLLNTTYAFKEAQTHAVVFRADELAIENGCSRRSIQEVMCDLERCGYLVRAKSGAPDGYTGVWLTRVALRDPNTYWVLKTKGRRVKGFVAWLDSVQDLDVNRAPKESTREFARPSINIEVIKPPTLEKSSAEIGTLREIGNPEAVASGNNSGSVWAEFISEAVSDANLRGKVSKARLDEFAHRVKTLKLEFDEVRRYVDFKIWEVTDVRQESYSAQTMVSILTADLVHHRAVTKNLEVLKRREIRRQIAEAAEERDRRLKEQRAEIASKREPAPPEPSPQVLSDWQQRLKERVSENAWNSFLSKLEQVDERTLRCDDAFVATWIFDHFRSQVLEVLGTCSILCAAPDGEVLEFDFDLEASGATSCSPFPAPEEPSSEESETDAFLEPWQKRLREHATGLDWRMFLSRLERRIDVDGVLELVVVDDPFVAEWLSTRYAKTIFAALGPVRLRCLQTGTTWRLV